MKIPAFFLAALVIVFATGCASHDKRADPPANIASAPAGNLQLAEVLGAGWQHYEGRQIRWGGTVVDVAYPKGEPEFEVLERKVDRRGQPYLNSSSAGRFVIAPHTVSDIEIGDDITVFGQVSGASERAIGTERRSFPVVAVSAHHRWMRERRRRQRDDHQHWHASHYIMPIVAAALLIGLGHHVGHYGRYRHGHFRFGYGHR